MNALRDYKQTKGLERAGVLVGVVLGDNRYRITKVSPSITSKGSTRTGCKRDADLANTYIQEQYELSEHTCIYLGEWHTHPEPHPKPSGVDVSSVIEIAYLPDIKLPFVVLCIVGLESIYWGCAINGQMEKITVNII